MVMIKADFTAHGQIGGVYFKRGPRDGLHIQAMPRSIRKISMSTPVTVPHSKGSRAWYIMTFTLMMTPYRQLILLGLLFAWAQAAAMWRFMNKNGNEIKMSAWSWFIHFNMQRKKEGLPTYTFPPNAPNELPDLIGTGQYFHTVAAPFYKSEQYNGRQSYKSNYENYGWTEEPEIKVLHIWWDGTYWLITPKIGTIPPGHFWINYGVEPSGPYLPNIPGDREITVSP